MAALIEAHTIGLQTARQAADAAVEAATSLGIAVCIAVVDRAGHLLSYDRMDGAQLLAGELAQDKAYTVASFGMATHQWWEFIREEPSLLHGVPKTDRLVIYGGGLPILAGDALVGAIGVAGGLPDQDREVAAAGVRACEDVLGVPA